MRTRVLRILGLALITPMIVFALLSAVGLTIELTTLEQAAAVGTRNLRSNEVRTRHLMAGGVTAGKLGYKAVAVTVLAAAATGSSAADPDLATGVLITCHPNSNQDQHVDNIVLNADGSITVTLAANATANNVFRCIALKPDRKGTF